MIDSHCHLDQEPLISDIKNILNRSKDIGIKKLLTICTSLISFEKILKILNTDNIIYGTFGIHPHESDNIKISKNIIINNVNKNSKIIGIGETGLDFYYNNSHRDKQIDSFKIHIESAIEMNVPLIVHSRNAEEDTYSILNSYKKDNPKILMHCFTGSYDFYKEMEKLNSFFSASGIITFNNSKGLQETFSKIPINKLLVETDSPFLAPIPMRGKKNEPSYIIHTMKKLSEIKNINIDKLINNTTNNFENLFFKK